MLLSHLNISELVSDNNYSKYNIYFMSDDEGGYDAKDGVDDAGDYDDVDLDASVNSEFENGDVQEEIIDVDERIKDGDEDLPKEVVKDKKEKITTRYLTKYEKARIIGSRALQISKNALIFFEIEAGRPDKNR